MTPKVVGAGREGAVVINLGGAQGTLDPNAGVFIDGRRVPNVVAVRVEADVHDDSRRVFLTLRPGDNVTVVGHATVKVEQDGARTMDAFKPDALLITKGGGDGRP